MHVCVCTVHGCVCRSVCKHWIWIWIGICTVNDFVRPFRTWKMLWIEDFRIENDFSVFACIWYRSAKKELLWFSEIFDLPNAHSIVNKCENFKAMPWAERCVNMNVFHVWGQHWMAANRFYVLCFIEYIRKLDFDFSQNCKQFVKIAKWLTKTHILERLFSILFIYLQ